MQRLGGNFTNRIAVCDYHEMIPRYKEHDDQGVEEGDGQEERDGTWLWNESKWTIGGEGRQGATGPGDPRIIRPRDSKRLS